MELTQVLARIQANGGSITSSELSKLAGISINRASESLTRAYKLGFLVRELRYGRGRPHYLYSLSEKGQQHLSRIQGRRSRSRSPIQILIWMILALLELISTKVKGEPGSRADRSSGPRSVGIGSQMLQMDASTARKTRC